MNDGEICASHVLYFHYTFTSSRTRACEPQSLYFFYGTPKHLEKVGSKMDVDVTTTEDIQRTA